jgi:hypothetical protein
MKVKLSRINKILLTVFYLVLVLITGCPATKDSVAEVDAEIASSPIVKKCGDFDRIPVREYLLDNNVWGKGNISQYQQCIWADMAKNPLTAGWSWRWGTVGERKKVKAYPEIHYGWDWDKKFTTPNLPLKVNQGKTIEVTYDVSTSAAGLYNLAFDLWFTKADFPTRENLSREVMVWVDGSKHNPGADPIKRVNIDGSEYDLFINHDWNSWVYFAFVKVIPQPKGVLNVHEFLSFLVKEGYISPNESLVEIEIGNEIWTGEGETTVKDYSIAVR